MSGNPQIAPIPIEYIRYEPGVKTTVSYISKGTVSAYEDLPATGNLSEGDMYQVGDTNDYYVWDGRYWNLVTLPESGGPEPTGTKQVTVTENGTITEDIAGYASVEIQTNTIKNITWHQCPDAVRNYIANVSYDPSDYTTTQVTNYAPSPAVSSNTKPIGKTVGSKTYYNSIPNEAEPFVQSENAGTVMALDQVRWINSKTNNFRDIGGWACDGGTVKYGKVYRSGNLHEQDEDLVMNELGIKVEIDFTNDGIKAYNGLNYTTHSSSPMYSLDNRAAWKAYLAAIFESVSYGSPLVFHCSMGADRTGTMACILEGLLGVSQSDIDKDYELTSFYYIRARNGNYQGGTMDWAHFIGQINALSGSTFRDKVVAFVLSLGFTVDEINAYRVAMIDGNPETLNPVIPSATVTNSLTNATTDNSASSISYYQTYEATITPSSGYVIDTISISMGGVDITSASYVEEVYPSNVVRISIPDVLGDIAISVTTVKSEVPNLFDATDADVVLRGRINSSGNAVAYADGQLVTGYIPASVGDTFTIITDKSLKTNGYTGTFSAYDESKNYIASIVNGSSSVWSFSDDDTQGVCTIPSTLNGKVYTSTVYARFCVAYTDINNIVITKG